MAGKTPPRDPQPWRRESAPAPAPVVAEPDVVPDDEPGEKAKPVSKAKQSS